MWHVSQVTVTCAPLRGNPVFKWSNLVMPCLACAGAADGFACAKAEDGNSDNATAPIISDKITVRRVTGLPNKIGFMLASHYVFKTIA